MNDIQDLSIEVSVRIVQLHNEIRGMVTTCLDKAIEIGGLLTEQKKQSGHGAFIRWIAENVPFTDRTARNYMNLYEHRDDIKNLDSLTSAYLQLAEPKTETVSDLIIDYEFSTLLPPLTDGEYKGLEKSIVTEGCRNAIVTWNNIILDGHQRYRICKKHNIPYKTHSMQFDDRDDAFIWIINNQLGRKNMNDFENSYMLGSFYNRKLQQTVAQSQA
jgi:hypothetical protein